MRKTGMLLLVAALFLCLPALVLSAVKEKSKVQKSGEQAAKQDRQKAPEKAGSSRVLVMAGNVPITQEEFELQFAAALEKFPADKRSLFTNPNGRRQFLNMLVDQKMWVNWALEQGLDKRPEVETLVRMSRDQVLLRESYNELVAKSLPTETEAQKFYDANPERFKTPPQANVRAIVLSDSTEAKKVLAQLKAGADFAKLAKEKSKDKKTAENGGDLGLLAGGAALPAPVGGSQEIEAAVFSLKSGQLSKVMKSDEGYVIVKVEKRIEPELMPFGSVRQKIEEGLTASRVQKLRSEIFEELKKKFPIQYFIEDSSISSSKSVAPPPVANTPEELFQAATDSKDSRQRISIYEQLLQKFPESKYAAQAQFMIGFVYSEELKDYAKAEEAFKLVTENYKDSELVDSAKWMLKNMRDESQKVGSIEDVKRKAKESKE